MSARVFVALAWTRCHPPVWSGLRPRLTALTSSPSGTLGGSGGRGEAGRVRQGATAAREAKSPKVAMSLGAGGWAWLGMGGRAFP